MPLDAGQSLHFQLRQNLLQQVRAGGRNLGPEVCQSELADLSQCGLAGLIGFGAACLRLNIQSSAVR